MDQNENPQQPPRRRGGLGSVLLPIILVVGMCLLFYFLFIRPSSRSTAKIYNDADIVYTQDPGAVYDPSTGGDLADILLGEEVLSLKAEANTAGRYYVIQGQYARFNDAGKKVKTNFQAQITFENWEYFVSIISDRPLYKTNSEGNYVVDANGERIVIGQYYAGDRNIYTMVNPNSGNGWTAWIPTILTTVLLIGMAVFIVSRLSKSMKDATKSQTDFNTSRARKEINSKIRFSDVAGCDEVKAELVEVVDYFRHADKYTKLGAKLPKGILLVGPPGTGKTLLAKAVAGEANVAFYSISGSDFVEMFVGVGAGRVRDMFKTAKQNAPCLIFIDEIDAVGRQRGAGLGGGNDEREQTLNQLLVEMDGFNDNSGVIVMAATNRSDVLDPALMRAGRFDRQITVDLPDKKGREAILRVHARNKVVDSKVDYANIAGRTVGFSGADLANVMNEAAILAVRANRNIILTKDIDEAIDRSIAGPARNSVTMSPEEKRQVAYHESGHAIIGLKLPYSDVVQKVTIVPRGRTGGHVLMTPEQDRFLMTKNQMIARITGYLGGRSSEEIFFNDVSTGASNDIEVATRLARSMVTEYGMSALGPVQYDQNQGSVFLGRDYTNSQRNFSAQIAYEIDKEVRQIIDSCHEKAREIISKYKDDVVLIAETLINKETLNSEEIKYLLEHRELPPEPEPEPEPIVVPPSPEAPDVAQTDLATPEAGATGINLPPDFDSFLSEFKRVLLKSPHKIALVAAVPGASDITFDQLKRIVYRFAPKETFVGTVFLSKELYSKLPVKIEEFAQYLEDSSSADMLLVKTSSQSVETLKGIVNPTTTMAENLKKAKENSKPEIDKKDNIIDAEPLDGSKSDQESMQSDDQPSDDQEK